MELHEAVPDLLSKTPEGSLRVGGTRVTLDCVIQAFADGATPEEICQDFPSLSLAQVYSVLAFYLAHKEELDRYLKEQELVAAALDQDLRARYAPFLAELRQRLLARRASPKPPA